MTPIYSGPSVAVLPFNAKISFARGQSDKQEVARICPYLGGNGRPFDRLRSFIRQKLAGHRQIMRPTEGLGIWEQVEECDFLVVAELTRLGYPLKWVDKALSGLPPVKNDVAVKGIRSRVRVAIRELRGANTTHANSTAAGSQRGSADSTGANSRPEEQTQEPLDDSNSMLFGPSPPESSSSSFPKSGQERTEAAGRPPAKPLQKSTLFLRTSPANNLSPEAKSVFPPDSSMAHKNFGMMPGMNQMMHNLMAQKMMENNGIGGGMMSPQIPKPPAGAPTEQQLAATASAGAEAALKKREEDEKIQAEAEAKARAEAEEKAEQREDSARRKQEDSRTPKEKWADIMNRKAAERGISGFDIAGFETFQRSDMERDQQMDRYHKYLAKKAGLLE